MAHWSNKLKKLDACSEAVKWAATQKSMSEAWKNCKRGDWMLWFAGRVCRTEKQQKVLVLAACDCAAPALKHVPKGENRPRIAIETARKWARDEDGVTLEMVRQADANAAYAANAASYAANAASYANAAYAASYAAYASYDAYASYAANAAYASNAASYAAYDAYDANAANAAYAANASYAAYAAYDANAANARTKSLAKSADIVRRYYPKAPRFI